MTSELVFWVAVSIPLYAFLGYPLVLLALRLMIRREVKKAPDPAVRLVADTGL